MTNTIHNFRRYIAENYKGFTPKQRQFILDVFLNGDENHIANGEHVYTLQDANKIVAVYPNRPMCWGCDHYERKPIINRFIDDVVPKLNLPGKDFVFGDILEPINLENREGIGCGACIVRGVETLLQMGARRVLTLNQLEELK